MARAKRQGIGSRRVLPPSRRRSATRSFRIRPQPDDSTCGPTCLHAVYRHFGDPVSLSRLISEVRPVDGGGTLAVNLALHALGRGYATTIYTYNLNLFDPVWFSGAGVDLAERLAAQARHKRDAKLRQATRAYLEFLSLGGTVRFVELTGGLIRRTLGKGLPVLTGLSATYLYSCSREAGGTVLEYDDVRGTPTGHFVVLYGLDRRGRVRVADPFHDNPRFKSHNYSISMERVIGAILLGVLTYDANLLVIEPPSEARRHR